MLSVRRDQLHELIGDVFGSDVVWTAVEMKGAAVYALRMTIARAFNCWSCDLEEIRKVGRRVERAAHAYRSTNGRKMSGGWLRWQREWAFQSRTRAALERANGKLLQRRTARGWVAIRTANASRANSLTKIEEIQREELDNCGKLL